MFLQLFREVGDQRDGDAIEALDVEMLRARIGARAPRAAERRRDALLARFDARPPWPQRTWRDVRRSP